LCSSCICFLCPKVAPTLSLHPISSTSRLGLICLTFGPGAFLLRSIGVGEEVSRRFGIAYCVCKHHTIQKMPHRPDPPTPSYPPGRSDPHQQQHPRTHVASPITHRPSMHPSEQPALVGYHQHQHHLHQQQPRMPYPYGSPGARVGYPMHPMWHHPAEMHYHMDHYSAQHQHLHQHQQHVHAAHLGQAVHVTREHPQQQSQGQKRDSPDSCTQELTRTNAQTPTRCQSEEEVAASALMMAASASVSSESTIQPALAGRRPESVPFKKRKKHLDFMRRNGGEIAMTQLVGQTPAMPCQISPVSNTSCNDQQHGHDTSPAQALIVQTSSSCQMDSYDAKDGQALTDSAKIGDTADIMAISPQVDMPSHPVILDFPSVLHTVLTHNVLQWLHHGKAWKIVRWDGLRREILPRYFSQLCHIDEDGRGTGSIDGFLWHVRAWGFCEITDGPDVGAYTHEYFVRDDPQLCRKMKFSTESESHLSNAEIQRSLQTPHNLLRVPSLAASRSDGGSRESSSAGGTQTISPEKRPSWTNHSKLDADTSKLFVASHGANYSRGSPSMWRPYMGHHPEDSHNLMRHYPPPASPTIMVACPPPYDSRYPFRPHADNLMRPPHHSPQVHSGHMRGAPGSTHQMLDSSSNQVGSYPVSMRGKGSRGVRPAPSRAPPPIDISADSLPTDLETPAEDDTVLLLKTGLPPKALGPKRQISNSEGSQIAMAILRKTKMKLPVSRNKASSSDPVN